MSSILLQISPDITRFQIADLTPYCFNFYSSSQSGWSIEFLQRILAFSTFVSEIMNCGIILFLHI